jgi:hypothetical protein
LAELDERVSRRISEYDFSRLFDAAWTEVPSSANSIFRRGDFSYRRPSAIERDEIILEIVRRFETRSYWVSGPGQAQIWERGWRENLSEYLATRDLARLAPKFLAGKKVLRFEGDYIVPSDPAFEFNLIDVYRRWLFTRFFEECNAVFEFGCGSCQHLVALAEIFPTKTMHGLDWADASLEIVDALAKIEKWNLKSHRFNMFEPDGIRELDGGGGVLTVGAMEQLGERFAPFVEFLLERKPRIVVHLETVEELYESANLLDFLALCYDARRNYLRGYLTHLRGLEGEGRIQMLRARRVRFGSMFHDSYSTLVWRPV